MAKRVCGALAVVLLGVLPAAAHRDEISISANGGAILVEATINDRLTGRFILDTGATYCVITRATADEAMMTVHSSGQKLHMQTANGPIEATLATARRIEIGDTVAHDVDVAVVEKLPMPGVRGLIGLSFLRRYRYSVDPGRGVLVLQY